MKPTVGRIVHYTLSAGDAGTINNRRHDKGLSGNRAEEGQVFPAAVVRVFDPNSSTANLSVLLDGEDTHWATSRTEGEGAGHWAWPPRS